VWELWGLFNICCKLRKKKKNKDLDNELDKIIMELKKEAGLGLYLNVYYLTVLNYFLQLLGDGFFILH